MGQVVLEHRDGFHVYKAYCTNLALAMATLEREEVRVLHDVILLPQAGNPRLKKELVKCQLAAKSPFPLSGRLSPVLALTATVPAHIVLSFQRLMKYHLLLNEVR